MVERNLVQGELFTAKACACFWKKVRRGDPGECWLFMGSRTEDGYGRFKFAGKPEGAHRVSWFLHFGLIPAGLHVLHSCDNPPCVNPSHLFLGTQGDNVQDMIAKGRDRHPKGEQHGRARLTTQDVRAIKWLLHLGLPQRVIARRFGVTRSAIRDIKSGRRWRHVSE